MTIKVKIQFELWPYEQSYSVEIPEDKFKSMDTYVDSITSNLKMSILSHVRQHHPNLWYKYSPLEDQKLAALKTDNKDQTLVK